MEKQSKYFEPEESISYRYGNNIDGILRTISSRYIGQNPPNPFVFRAFNKEGILCNKDGRFNIDLKDKLPHARFGQASYICAKFWKSKAGKQDFIVSCYSPTTIFINNNLIYKSTVREDVNVAIEKTISISYEKGWNTIFIRCIKTTSGFGCILGPYEPRWFWVNFLNPLNECEGIAGFVYSDASDVTDISQLPQQSDVLSWKTNSEWSMEQQILQPFERLFQIEEGRFAYAWTKLVVNDFGANMYKIELDTSGQTTLFIDGQQVATNFKYTCIDLELSYGKHDVFVVSKCSRKDHWGFKFKASKGDRYLKCILPYDVKGEDSDWLYLGSFSHDISTELKSINEMQTMYKLFTDGEVCTYWQLDKPGVVVRPYLENELFAKWNYPLGVTLYGLLQVGRVLGREDIIKYVLQHIKACTSLYKYSLWDSEKYGYPEINNQLVGLKMLDDCGSFGSAMLESISENIEDYKYLSDLKFIGEQIANHMENLQERQKDGAFYRICKDTFMENTLWVDDLYMSTPFLCRYYKLSGDTKYINDAVKQFKLFKKYLFIEEYKIMAHVYDFKYNTSTQIPWGRGNGWCMFSLSELLEYLPTEHLDYKYLVRFFNELCEGYLTLQGANGLWHQVLTHRDSYEESSCTAMLVYAFARGLRFGIIDEDKKEKVIHAVYKGWKGLTEKAIDQYGNVHGVCAGSAYSFTTEYYKNELLWVTNDTHGIGIVMLAGIEVSKLDVWLEDCN